jgi:molybdate transport system regulatory protein
MRADPPRLKIKVQLMSGEEIALGPGKAELLEWVSRTGSISAAAKSMGLSYRRAWLLIDAMNRCFAAPLVETSHGGAKGGGARVTAAGEAALAKFRKLEDAVARTANAKAGALLDQLR